MSRPTHATVAGRAYLALRKHAKAAGRPTDEYLRLYALEGFLLRLSQSQHRDRFVLKGGVLLAAHGMRRPTADIDMAALQTANEQAEIQRIVVEVAATHLPEDLDDGLEFDLTTVSSEVIRDEDEYSGLRVHLRVRLATADLRIHVDVNIGDPIWPEPARIAVPRLLDGEPIEMLGYELELALAEKIVTALQRGVASTRWRDFGDLLNVPARVAFTAGPMLASIGVVAQHRQVELRPFREVLVGYGAIGQASWAAWRVRNNLQDSVPESFADVVEDVSRLVDPLLAGEVDDSASWDTASLEWVSS